MIAMDTNVIVRVVTADDPEQLEVAKALLSDERLWLCKTVLLETEWVLRFSYELSRDVIREAFRRLLGLENLEMEDRSKVLVALGWYGEGMDFAEDGRTLVHVGVELDRQPGATYGALIRSR